MSQYISKRGLIWMLLVVLLVESKADQSAFRLVVTNGQAILYRDVDNGKDQQVPIDEEIGPATTASIISTNVSGFWFIMATPTNRFVLGHSIPCRSLSKNTTTNRLPISWDGTGAGVPEFGKLTVIKPSGQQAGMKTISSKPSTRVSTRIGGMTLSSEGIRHAFDLNDLFEFTETGQYRVLFTGKIPSPVDRGVKLEFQTPPLIITIVPTNIAPNDIKKSPVR